MIFTFLIRKFAFRCKLRKTKLAKYIYGSAIKYASKKIFFFLVVDTTTKFKLYKY